MTMIEALKMVISATEICIQAIRIIYIYIYRFKRSQNQNLTLETIDLNHENRDDQKKQNEFLKTCFSQDWGENPTKNLWLRGHVSSHQRVPVWAHQRLTVFWMETLRYITLHPICFQ